MFIYQEITYKKYAYDKIKIGINLANNTITLKHTYKRNNTVITEPQEIVQFLEHLLALAQPVQNEADEQRIQTIKPLLNQMYGYTNSTKVTPDDTFLPININYSPDTSDNMTCPCGKEHEQQHLLLRAKAEINFSTKEEKIELKQVCPKTGRYPQESDYLTSHTQNTLNLNNIPINLKDIWELEYKRAKQI